MTYPNGKVKEGDWDNDKFLGNKSLFKKIAIITIVSVVLLTAGIIVYNSQKNSLSIPVGVTSIGNREYTRKQLIEIEIPDSVTTIGKEAFKKNKLSSVEIPDSVTSIGDNAFINNKLTTITIGTNVMLGSNVFDADFDEFYTNNGSSAGTYKCYGKKSPIWSAWSGDSMFHNFRFQYNGGTISILGYDGSGGHLVIPEEISGYPVTIIGRRAFYPYTIFEERAFYNRNGFTNVIIPDSVTIIEEGAFLGGTGEREWFENGAGIVIRRGTISDVSIGTGVTTIGVNAFANNQVTSIRLGANVALGDVGNDGILGQGTGFNGTYNNGKRAGTYTRPNTESTTWTRR
jgi:acetyltransferase-like isoleucine patch superfamily enzyme